MITSVVETGGDGAPTAQWTGNTFTGPAIGTYTVPTFAATAKCFADRTHAWTNASGSVLIPSYLLGNEYIMIRNDNRDNAGLRLDVTVSQDVQVYLLIDNRLGAPNSSNDDPPSFGPTKMSWVTNEGWAPVINGINRTGNLTYPDEVGIDENADGSINRNSSVYSKSFPAGTFQLKQPDNGGQNMYGVVVVGVGPTAPPAAPSGLTAINGDTQVLLTWAAPASATGYNIKRASGSGGPYTVVGTTAGTNFTDSPLANAVDYFYVVSATNILGESTNSLEVIGHPNPVVTGITATGGTNQVALTWNALASADSYSVLRANASGGPFTTAASGLTGTSYVDPGLQSGRTFYYRVSASLSGGVGQSGQSATVSASTAPSAPVLNAMLFASTVIRLGWTTDPVVSQFFIESSTDGVNYSPLVTLAGNVLTYTNTGLSLSNTYYYRIQATNGGGSSPYSNVASTNTPVFGLNVNFGAGADNSANAGLISPVPPGYLNDIGDIFGDRTNGQFYGWITPGATNANPPYGTNIVRDARWRRSALSPDLRYDTFNHMMKANTADPSIGAIWEIQVPNGPYVVHIVSGESDNADEILVFDVEGTITPTYNANGAVGLARWADMTVSCAVSDGRLTIKSAPGAVNSKICFVDIYPDIPIPPIIAVEPQSQTLEEYRPVSLSVTLSQGSPRLDYQWYFNNNLLEGATNRVLTFAHVRATNAGDYFLIVTNYGGAATSQVATLTVTQDVTTPYVVSVGSMDGRTIGICFNEELDNSQSTVTEAGNYSINGNTVTIDNVTFRPDGRSVQLQLHDPITGSFTVDVLSQYDLAQNYLDFQETNSTVLGFTTGDVGNPARSGTNYTCDNQTFELVGGGADIWGNGDQGYFATKPVNGDFDARVRVTALVGSNTITKADLVVRETINSNSPALHVSVNPPPPGRDQIEMGLRSTVGGATVAVGTNFIPAGVPNAWMRLTRVGNTFTGYRSTDGVNWIALGQTNVALSASTVVGLAVTAHDTTQTLLATGTFTGFSIVETGSADLAIAKVASPNPVAVGSDSPYTVTVTNLGTSTAFAVVVTDVLPAGYVSATPSQGSCSVADGIVTCNLGALNANSSATISIVVHANAAGSLTNSVSMTSATADPNTGNNSATAVARVVTQPSAANFSFSGGSFSASFQTEVGSSYEIQYKHDLTDQWQTLTTITGDGTVKLFSDSSAPPDRRFYRIVVH